MADQEERRIDRRMRALKGGRIVFNRGYGAADCTIRNLSSGGAMIETAEPVSIPSEFVLYINPERQGRPCRVAWRYGRQIGITFTASQAEFAARPVSQSLLRAN